MRCTFVSSLKALRPSVQWSQAGFFLVRVSLRQQNRHKRQKRNSPFSGRFDCINTKRLLATCYWLSKRTRSALLKLTKWQAIVYRAHAIDVHVNTHYTHRITSRCNGSAYTSEASSTHTWEPLAPVSVLPWSIFCWCFVFVLGRLQICLILFWECMFWAKHVDVPLSELDKTSVCESGTGNKTSTERVSRQNGPPCTFRLNNYATTHLQWTHTPSLSLLSFKASQDTELCQYHSKFLAWAVWMLFGSNHNTQMDGSSKLVSPTFTLLSGIL